MISQAETPTTAKPAKEDLEPMVISAKRDYSRYIETKKLLENPSRVLKRTKEGMRLGLDLWREMEDDDQIVSDLNIRRLKVSSFPIEITVEDGTEKDKQQAKELKKQIEPVYRRLLKETQDALICGYSITELNWEMKDGRVELPSVTGHKQDDFTFTQEGDILWESESGNTIPVNPKRVLAYSFDMRKGNRYGRSLLSGCFWPWYFKKHGLLFWSNYLERFGQPTVVGYYPPGTQKDKKTRLLEALQAIQNEMAVTLEKGWEVELIEAQRSGALDSYEKFIQYCNRCISKVILMTVLTSNESQFGTRAQAQVHKDISDECIEDDALGYADAITNQVVKRLAQWNYNFTVKPKLVIQYQTEDTSKEEAEKDGLLTNTIPISASYLYGKYNVPEPGDDDYVTYRGIYCKKKDLPLYLPPQESPSTAKPAPQAPKDNRKKAEFAKEITKEKIQENDRLILEENEIIERHYTANREEIKKAYEIKRLEKLLEKPGDYKDAIIALDKYKTKKLARAWEPHLTYGLLLGEYTVQRQKEAIKTTGADFAVYDEEDFRKLEAKDAVRWLKRKTAVTGETWKLLEAEAKQAAFYVSQVEDLKLINYVKGKMIKSIREGMPYRQFKKEIFQESGVEPFFGNMYTSYHTNMYTALGAQNEAALKRSTDQFKWWRYTAVLDGKTRPHHEAMHGIVAKYDDPIWKIWSPPNGFNCRCRKVIAFNNQIEAGNRKNRQMGYLELQPDPGWEHSPGEGMFKNYKEIIKEKKIRGYQLNKAVREAS